MRATASNMFTPLATTRWLAAALAIASVQPAWASQSPKRGLAFVPNSAWPDDDAIWTRNGTGLTWYYNFAVNASAQYAAIPQAALEFVPMMWGAPALLNDTSFLRNVTRMRADGRNISHVLSFNGPDAAPGSGGAGINATIAAKVWMTNLAPLREKGVKVGLPVMIQRGDPAKEWLDAFLGNCSALAKKECGFDFVPLHSFGDFDVLKQQVETYSLAYVPAFHSITA